MQKRPDEAENTEALERRRRNRRFNTVLYCIGGALMLAGVFIILRSETPLFTKNSSDEPEPSFDETVVVDQPTQTPAEATPAPSDPAAANPTYPPPTETAAPRTSDPIRIFFLGHDVQCRIEPVGVTEDGVMETVPSHNVVGWYKFGAAPGEQGNCIIAGHNKYNGQYGSFSLLHDGLEIGDRVAVSLKDGSTCYYVVQSITTYPYDNVPASVMETGGERRLTLITCLGDFDYDMQMSRSRVVAVCIPVN